MDVYAENILDHYRHPRGKGPITPAEQSVVRTEDNPTCGDTLTVGLCVENDTVVSVLWEGEGCAISQAAMSILTEELTGKSVSAITGLHKADVLELLSVDIGPRRMKCALLAAHALKNAVLTLNGKPPQSWLETTEVAGQ